MQLTGASRVNILSSALIYTNAKTNVKPYALKRPLSNTDYIAYKKAQILAASQNGVRPVQTSIITDLQEFNAVQCSAGKS
jgi:hypothetical protein